jgi:hypothetical protein
MSILWLIVFALLIGVVIYRSFYTLVKSVRLAAVFLSMAAFIVIVQNLEKIGRIWNSAGALHVAFFSDKRAANISNPNDHPGSVTDVAFQSIVREDQNFLDEFTQTQSQNGQSPRIPTPLQVPGVGNDGIVRAGDESRLKTELVVNALRVKRAVLVPHKETVKRAQLVMQTESSKHAELVRSGQR